MSVVTASVGRQLLTDQHYHQRPVQSSYLHFANPKIFLEGY